MGTILIFLKTTHFRGFVRIPKNLSFFAELRADTFCDYLYLIVIAVIYRNILQLGNTIIIGLDSIALAVACDDKSAVSDLSVLRSNR